MRLMPTALFAHGHFAAMTRCCSSSTNAFTVRPTARAPYPGADYAIPFGKASVVRAGKDVTVITYGAVVPRALRAAQLASSELGLEVELIDLRTLNPYDWEAIAISVKKTGRVIVAHEDMLSWGYGAEIAARIADELFDYLDAPVKTRRRDGYICRLPANPRRRDPASTRRSLPSHGRRKQVLAFAATSQNRDGCPQRVKRTFAPVPGRE